MDELGNMNPIEKYRYLNHLLDRTTDPSKIDRIMAELNLLEMARINALLEKDDEY